MVKVMPERACDFKMGMLMSASQLSRMLLSCTGLPSMVHPLA